MFDAEEFNADYRPITMRFSPYGEIPESSPISQEMGNIFVSTAHRLNQSGLADQGIKLITTISSYNADDLKRKAANIARFDGAILTNEDIFSRILKHISLSPTQESIARDQVKIDEAAANLAQMFQCITQLENAVARYTPKFDQSPELINIQKKLESSKTALIDFCARAGLPSPEHVALAEAPEPMLADVNLPTPAIAEPAAPEAAAEISPAAAEAPPEPIELRKPNHPAKAHYLLSRPTLLRICKNLPEGKLSPTDEKLVRSLFNVLMLNLADIAIASEVAADLPTLQAKRARLRMTGLNQTPGPILANANDTVLALDHALSEAGVAQSEIDDVFAELQWNLNSSGLTVTRGHGFSLAQADSKQATSGAHALREKLNKEIIPMEGGHAR